MSHTAGLKVRCSDAAGVDIGPVRINGYSVTMANPSRLPTLLVVDDEPTVLKAIGRVAQRQGFDVVACSNGHDALAMVEARRLQLALVDLRMPEVGGMQVLKALRERDPDCQVILMTGYGSIDNAVEAIKLGARDYLTKPFEFDRLTKLLRQVHDEIERRAAVQGGDADLARRLEFCGMVGRGPRMRALFDLVERMAPHVRTALITGPTGSGKELVARALHSVGPRSGHPLRTLNCSAVVDTLFESELFGHVRGAFTGAVDNKPGLFELAHRGTLFLDEVGELPLPAQAKLLRALETREVQRVGATETKQVDVTVFAATNRDLRAWMESGRFRADLFFRLAVVELEVPPLPEHPEDIPYMTAVFVREIAERVKKPVRGVSAAAEALLMGAPWPGNVRELRNVLERAVLMTDGAVVTERELEVAMRQPGGSGLAEAGTTGSRGLVRPARDTVLDALNRAAGNKQEAARQLGLGRRAFYRRLEALGLDSTIARRPARKPGDTENLECGGRTPR